MLIFLLSLCSLDISTCHTILEINRSLSSGMGNLHLQQLEAEVTPDILSTSSFSSMTSVSSSAMLVLLSDLLSSTADVTLLMTTWSEMDPDEEFLDLVVIELRLDSLWVEMFLVLGHELTVVTLEALEDSRDLRGVL